MARIDEIDTLILRELLKDGRKSFTDIAKKCNLTKGAIAKRYEEMKKAGIVVGSTIQFNYQKFGYSGVALILLSVESQYVNNVYEHISKIQGISGFRYYTATHNIATISMLKNLRELEYVKEVISRESPINEIKTYIWTGVRNIPENILPIVFEKKNDKKIEIMPYASIDTQKSSVKLDELDMQIVEKLTKNGRISFRKIAQELGNSTDTIARRFENLRKDNYIKVSIQIDPTKLEYQANIHIFLALTNQRDTNEIADKLANILGISYLVKISGDYDLQISALVKDFKDVIRINDEIGKIPNIKKTEGTIIPLRSAWPGPRQYISTF